MRGNECFSANLQLRTHIYLHLVGKTNTAKYKYGSIAHLLFGNIYRLLFFKQSSSFFRCTMYQYKETELQNVAKMLNITAQIINPCE